MQDTSFLDVAIKNLPGGLILCDLQGRLRAINKTAEDILGLAAVPSGRSCESALADHPKLFKILDDTMHSLNATKRQEVATHRPDGEKVVLGYSTLILKDAEEKPLGVGLSFQDITRFIPLMDAHQFLDLAMRNLPGGLIFIDLQGKVRGVNQMAERLLALSDIEPGTECHKAFADHPQVVKVLLSTCQSLKALNRQELMTRRPDGEKLMLGYGTLIIRNAQNVPVGIGLTFQDITRFIPLPLQAEFVRLVDRFFTPFAFILVTAAIWLGYAEPWANRLSMGLLIAITGFNEGLVWMAKKKPNMTLAVGYVRLAANFVGNVVLVYLLGTFWGPMWLLFVLTPVVTALHADWKKTLGTSFVCAGALLGIYASRGLEGPVGWGQAGLHATFIVFISLFVNSVARLVMQIRSGTYQAAKSSTKPGTPSATAAEQTQKLAA